MEHFEASQAIITGSKTKSESGNCNNSHERRVRILLSRKLRDGLDKIQYAALGPSRTVVWPNFSGVVAPLVSYANGVYC